ncbi:MAG: dihydrodipicolinate synthase family protein [Capsulimonadaceae bacterium]|nr:dihydrodipicolinate synthase family protein [Capsulimonadaceae bacterium]
MTTKLTGLIAAPFTPLLTNGEMNLPLVEKQADHLLRTGVSGVFVAGTTGEGASLTLDERMALAKRWVDVAGRDLIVLIHVGTNCGKDSQALAAHAQKIGVAGIGALSPSFFKPIDIPALLDFLAPVAASARALPFYYYQIPSFTGVSFPASQVLAQGAVRIPNLAGVKFTYEDFADFAACLALNGGAFDCLFGRDEKLLDGLRAGSHGAIGSTYNLAAGLSRRIIDAFDRGDLAEAARLQAISARFIDIVYGKYTGLPTAKVLSKLIGIDLGPVRPPLKDLSAEQEKAVIGEVEAIGFPDFAG